MASWMYLWIHCPIKEKLPIFNIQILKSLERNYRGVDRPKLDLLLTIRAAHTIFGPFPSAEKAYLHPQSPCQAKL